MSAVDHPETGRARQVAFLLLIFLLSLPAGYVVLTVVDLAINALWFNLAVTATGPALWALVLGLPVIAGVLVALIRSHGDDGHNPMLGIELVPVTGRMYPSIIGAIVVSLVCGIVIGPEAAMVCTGAVIGTVIGRRAKLDGKKATAIGAGGAILALFVDPLIDGDFSLAPTYVFEWKHLVGGVVIGVVTSLVIMLGRHLALGIMRIRGGDKPKVIQLAIAGLLVGAVALVYQVGTSHSVNLVLTSGESNVKEMLELGTTGAIAITVFAKWLAYSITMGGGFRGGPFFPAIYIGCGVGAIATLLVPSYALGAVVAGFAASVVYLAHPKWGITLAVAVVLGMIGGGPELIPLAIAAAAAAKLWPAVTMATKPATSG